MSDSGLSKLTDEELEREIIECEKIIKECDEQLSLKGELIDTLKMILTMKMPPDIPNWREKTIYARQAEAKRHLDMLKEEKESRNKKGIRI